MNTNCSTIMIVVLFLFHCCRLLIIIVVLHYCSFHFSFLLSGEECSVLMHAI